MKLRFWRYNLKLARKFVTARELEPGGLGGSSFNEVIFVELTGRDGETGLGEASPSDRYGETADTAASFLQKVVAEELDFQDVTRSMEYIESLGPGEFAAKGALNMALLDGAARLAGKPLHDLLGLPFQDGRHVSSFTIGIDDPTVVREKVIEAQQYPILKVKIGGPWDRECLATVRQVALNKVLRVDANEAWKTKEDALRNIEWLAAQGPVEFVEQPMPATTPLDELRWLKERSPVPIMADESYRSVSDLERCEGVYHAVNVKLVKAGGVSAGFEALAAARRAGLKTMLGCMIESSLLISAAAHLAELTDYLDLDGNLLITNDPFRGVRSRDGVLFFADAPSGVGLQVAPTEGFSPSRHFLSC